MLEIIERIPVGHVNAMQRPADSNKDRRLREAIEYANNHGDCILNTGHGYYRPNPKDIEDVVEFNEYQAKELHRARAIQAKRLSMRLTFERWREVEVLIDYTGKAQQSK
jgi:hypothetical protein